MFVEKGTVDVTSQGSIICSGFPELVFVTELGSFVCDIGSRFKSCSSGISTLSRLIANRKCLRFLRTTLKGFWMTYDGSVGLLAMTFPGTLSADLTLHELSHLALGREGVAVQFSCQSADGMQFWIARPFW